MPSLLPGYAYDLFISYRQNDNARGWVTQFVSDLKEELAATLKDSVSVYFDANPVDGLLETHQVDKSLEGKLKCIILLPIVSQTYCDPKSFAWHQEFQPFSRLSQSDALGRDIRLPSGNVASRILPVRIHDLDLDDRTLLEGELGGPIRSVEFIFRSAGVNRPLLPTDDPNKNQNRTDYRDQLNKVANAVKELIYAVKYPGKSAESHESKPDGRAVTLQDVAHNSVAVLPFVNLSQDPSQEYFADGIMENILMELSRLRQLRVISRTSVMRFRKTDKSAPQIASELGVKHILEGSAQAHGNRVRIHVQLVDATRDEPVWAKSFSENMDDIFAIQSSVAEAVASELKASLVEEKKTATENPPTRNLKAYDLFLKGRHAFNQWNLEGYRNAERYFQQAVAEDADFTQAYSSLASTYSALMSWNGDLTPKESLEKIQKYLPLAVKRGATDNDRLTEAFVAFFINKDFKRAEEKLYEAMKLGPNNADVYFTYSYVLSMCGRPADALLFIDKACSLDPTSVSRFNYRAIAEYLLQHYEQAKGILQEALALFPNVLRLYDHMARLLVTTGNFADALAVIDSGLRIATIRPPSMVAYQVRALAGLGQIEKAQSLAGDLEARSSNGEKGVNLYAAHSFLALSDRQKAARYLEKARETNDVDLIWLQVDPLLADLRERPNYDDAEQLIRTRLQAMPKDLLYHNLDHIEDVLTAAVLIGKAEKLTADELQLLRIAALLHDAGLIVSLVDHEEAGSRMAKEVLPAFGFSEVQVNSVRAMILATRIPQAPTTRLEKVLCDADLDYLGREDFFTTGKKLYEELKRQEKVKSELEWNRMQREFLEAHQYHTEYSRNNREPVKKRHLEQIKGLLKT